MNWRLSVVTLTCSADRQLKKFLFLFSSAAVYFYTSATQTEETYI